MTVVFSGGYTADAAVTTTPDNTVSRVGTRVQLQCTTDRTQSPTPITWIHNPGTDNDYIVNNCQEDSSFPQYSVASSSTGQCDLVINNVSLELAATYRCSDVETTADANLTVIGELLL